jgi:hypothetical protein
MSNGERWLPVVGCEGYYEVSDCGRVRSIDRVVRCGDGTVRRYRGKLLSQGVDKHERRYVALSSGGVSITQRVHVLVLTAFVGPRPPGFEGCHGDDDPANNYWLNLRWATSTENKLDRVRNGIHHNANKTVCPLDHLLQMPNLVPSALPGRNCLACKYAQGARDRARQRGNEFNLRACADSYYTKIMGTVLV